MGSRTSFNAENLEEIIKSNPQSLTTEFLRNNGKKVSAKDLFADLIVSEKLNGAQKSELSGLTELLENGGRTPRPSVSSTQEPKALGQEGKENSPTAQTR